MPKVSLIMIGNLDMFELKKCLKDFFAISRGLLCPYSSILWLIEDSGIPVSRLVFSFLQISSIPENVKKLNWLPPKFSISVNSS